MRAGVLVLIACMAALALGVQDDARGERPRAVTLACASQSGQGAGLRELRSRRNLVLGPLALEGAATKPAPYVDAFGGNKFPAFLRGGHRVTVAVQGAGLVYGQDAPAAGYRAVTFVACRRGEIGGRFDGWPVSFWAGGVVARSPRCVPLRVWVDDEPSPRRAVIHLGVRRC